MGFTTTTNQQVAYFNLLQFDLQDLLMPPNGNLTYVYSVNELNLVQPGGIAVSVEAGETAFYEVVFAKTSWMPHQKSDGTKAHFLLYLQAERITTRSRIAELSATLNHEAKGQHAAAVAAGSRFPNL